MAGWKESKQITNISPEDISLIDTLSYLQAKRIKKNISQSDFAKLIDMTQPQLAKIERLDSIPSLKTLERYAKGLGLRISFQSRKITQLALIITTHLRNFIVLPSSAKNSR